MKPITPAQAKKEAKSNIPKFVVEGVNNAIKTNYCKGGFTISQKDIIEHIIKVNPEMNSENLLRNKWLDFEPLYENVGWDVRYTKPDRGESFDPYFKFEEKCNVIRNV